MAIESIMYFALGFLLASLFMIIVLPSVWKRAVRLTKKRIEAAVPITMAEFRADKDQLRAEFALSSRKLERTIETLRNRLTEQLSELNTAKSALAIETTQRARVTAAQVDSEARASAASDRIIELEKKIADLSQQLRGRERHISNLANDAPSEAPRVDVTEKRSAIDSIRQAISFSDKQTFDAVDGINEAYSRISRAGSNLDAILNEQTPADEQATRKTSLADELSQSDARDDLRENIKNIEKRIHKDWDKDKADTPDLRNRLEDIATKVSALIYATDSEPERGADESLFDRIRKFAGDDVDALELPAADKSPRTEAPTGPSLSERIAAYQDMHAGN